MQIRSRLTLQFIVVVSLIILFAFGIIYYSSSSFRKMDVYQRLEAKARTSAEIFLSGDEAPAELLRNFDRRQKDKLPNENISFYDVSNHEIYTNNDTISFSVTADLLNDVRKNGSKKFNEGEYEIIGLSYTDKEHPFVVFTGAVDFYGKRKIDILRNTLVILFLATVSIVAITGWIYSGRALQPLTRVMNEVQELDLNHLEKRLNSEGKKDEIGRLINTFNLLLERVETAFKLQKLFVSGASHELKNPLTSITSQLQVVLLKERNAEEYKNLLKSILDDIGNLNRTTHDLMEYARLNYENEVHLNQVRIDDTLWFCRDFFRKTYPDCKVTVKLNELPEDQNRLIVKGNEALLKIAFINLIENACKFSENKTCEISLTLEPNGLRIDFGDHGIGLNDTEMQLIFEPFYRSDNTAEKKGHGIGLALVKKIIELHGAKISVKSQKDKGSVFSLMFYN